MNRAVFVCGPELETATVCKPKCQFRVPSMKIRDAWTVERSDVALDFDVSRDRFTFQVGEVLVDGEMIVNASEVCVTFKHVPIASGLFN